MPATVKKWYQKFKLMVALGTVILEVIIAIGGTAITAVYEDLMIYVLALGISLIGGHAFTDAMAALKNR